MSTSDWKDPLITQPTDGMNCWIRVAHDYRQPIQATGIQANANFGFAIGPSYINLAVWNVVAWRPV